MRVLVAPDCFGDSLTAVEAADAIAAGWRQSRPDDLIDAAPQSDGGPGFVDVLAGRLGSVHTSRVSGPLDDDVDARWLLDGSTAYVESAQACGLAVLGGPPTRETAVAAHTRGVGQLIAAALAAGATTVVVGLGGSATTDGGRGMVEALGGLAAARARLEGIALIAASDVEHPLLGPRGAAHVFGPQKGADPGTVEALERRMVDWAAQLDAGAPVSERPGAGAAGGLGGALLALGARRESGATVVATHIGLFDDVAAADLVITGEGRLDDQSLHGKVISALAREARRHGVPVLVLAGQVTLGDDELSAAGISDAHAVADYAGSVELAISDAANQLTGLARRTAASFTTGAGLRE